MEIGQHWHFLISIKKMKASTQSVCEWENIMNNIVLTSLFEVRPSRKQTTQEYLKHWGQISLSKHVFFCNDKRDTWKFFQITWHRYINFQTWCKKVSPKVISFQTVWLSLMAVLSSLVTSQQCSQFSVVVRAEMLTPLWKAALVYGSCNKRMVCYLGTYYFIS